MKGRRFLEHYVAELRETRDQDPVTTRCAFCRRVHRGTLASGREWHAEHRLTHPQAKHKTTGRSKKTIVPGSDVTENIAHTRAQGGGSWMEDAA